MTPHPFGALTDSRINETSWGAMNEYWPIFGIRLRAGDVELRPTVDDDLRFLAELQPGDLELDPARTMYGRGAVDRGTWSYQSYWRSIGNWRPDSWNLQFSVFEDGVLRGVQTLEGDDFARLRTVDTSSWLIPEARGRGLGKAMRLAVLALAFEGLHAELAITEAWQDNHASLGVSHALGYVDNGWYLHAKEPDEVATMVRMRLARGRFEEHNPDHGVRIDALEPCLPFFGLG